MIWARNQPSGIGYPGNVQDFTEKKEKTTKCRNAHVSRMKCVSIGYGASVTLRNMPRLQQRARGGRGNRNARRYGKRTIPVLSIGQMTDEKWNELTGGNRIE